MYNKSAKKELFKISLVLLGGVFLAFTSIVTAIYFFGATGDYTVKNILIDPTTLTNLKFESKDPPLNKQIFYQFDHLEYFSYSGKETLIPIDIYKKVYLSLSNKTNLSEKPIELERFFKNFNYSSLVFYIVGSYPFQSETKQAIFQEIHFSKERPGLFRVEIRQSKKANKWAYFYDPTIKETIFTWINQK